MYVGIESAAALLAGILILIFPRIVNYLIAFYLILIGLNGLFLEGRGVPAS